ncbi:MAG: hypothetical protein KGH74_04255 [Candidatus Micrarchaeota archaeon]|nr:hypothetical protein [Candidatus Micrarchaeota archaeon]
MGGSNGKELLCANCHHGVGYKTGNPKAGNLMHEYKESDTLTRYSVLCMMPYCNCEDPKR